MSCNLLAYERSLADQQLILIVILSIKGEQSLWESLLVTSVIPNYLLNSVPHLKLVVVLICSTNALLIPEQKNSLFFTIKLQSWVCIEKLQNFLNSHNGFHIPLGKDQQVISKTKVCKLYSFAFWMIVKEFIGSSCI